MNFKRILILVMTFAMLLGTFAPTLGVFAEELHNHSHGTGKETIEYVSLGDSMTNGFGMEGYDKTELDGVIDDSNGYLAEAPDAYPSQFKEWLKEFTGNDVNLTQLATSAVRIEDIYYILNHGTENEFEPEYWTRTELLERWKRWERFGADSVANTHREAVKNADIISLATGNGNFGVFLMGRIMNLVGFGSAEGLADDQANYAYMTIENAVALCGGNAELEELVMDMYEKAYNYLAEMGLPMDLIDTIANYAAYTTASYVVHSMKTLDLIIAMNPDVTLILVPLMNNGLNFKFEVTRNGITKAFDAGDFLGALYTPLNAFLAAYTTAKQEMGEYKNAELLYAKLPTKANGEKVQIEMFAQAFEELYAPIVDLNGDGNITLEEYPESRLFCHDRFYEEIQDFIMPILMGGTSDDYTGQFNDNDVREYEIAKANGTLTFAAYAAANPKKVELISYYLGIVEGVLSAMQSVANVNIDEITVVEGGEFTIFSILAPVIGDVESSITSGVEANANAIAMDLYLDLINANLVPALVPYFSDPMLVGLFGIDTAATDLENTLYVLDLALNDDYRFDINDDLKGMKAQLVNAHNQVQAAVPSLAMALVLPDVMGEELTNVGLLEALLALYGRLKLAFGLSAHPSQAGHDTLTESLALAYENKYTTKDETLANIDRIVALVEKSYEKAYAYVDAHGYTNKVVSVIDRAINRINRVDLSDNKMTSEFRIKLQTELDATVATLKELREAVVIDKAKNIDGLIATILALKDDLKIHLVNVAELCKQLGIDFINLDEVQAVIEAVNEMVNVIVEVTTEYVIPVAQQIYAGAKVIVPIVVKVVLFAVDHTDDVAEIINTIINVYHYTYDLLIDTFGSIENAMAVALKICDYIANIIVKTPGVVDGLTGFVSELYDIIVSVYGETHNVITIAEAVRDYIIDSLNALNSSILDRIDATTNGNYELKEDSAYVAIGGSTYGPELAKLLNLSNKFTKFGVEDDYFDAIAKADLITIKVNNGEFYEFAYTQLMGTVANILRSNSDLMGWCNNKLVGKEVRATIEQYGIDIDAQTIELEWNKYLNANQKALLDAFLAEVESKVLATGLTETFEIDITSQIEEILEEKGLMLPGVSISVEPIVIPVTDLVVYAVENLVYSYVQFMERTTTLLANIRDIAPDASVVITHVASPLANLPFDISSLVPGFESYTQMLDGVVDALNVYLYALAFVNDNTIFVDSEDAQDIYDALHVFCRHKYDGCTDPDCNICGQVRENPKHSFTDYVKNNDATCTKPGTETAKCDFCDETDTRDTGRPLGHNIIIDASVAATCTKTGLTQGQHCSRCDAKTIPQKVVPALGHDYDYDCDKDCNRCGATRPASHKFGDWTIIEPATYIREGLREHRCIYCGLVERENYEAVKEDVNIVAVIALAVGSLIVAFGSATAIILLIQKKREK